MELKPTYHPNSIPIRSSKKKITFKTKQISSSTLMDQTNMKANHLVPLYYLFRSPPPLLAQEHSLSLLAQEHSPPQTHFLPICACFVALRFSFSFHPPPPRAFVSSATDKLSTRHSQQCFHRSSHILDTHKSRTPRSSLEEGSPLEPTSDPARQALLCRCTLTQSCVLCFEHTQCNTAFRTPSTS